MFEDPGGEPLDPLLRRPMELKQFLRYAIGLAEALGCREREFERLGSTRTQQVDVRVVAATHRDLKQMVGTGSSGAIFTIACTFSHCLFRPCESTAKTFLPWYVISWTNMLGA